MRRVNDTDVQKLLDRGVKKLDDIQRERQAAEAKVESEKQARQNAIDLRIMDAIRESGIMPETLLRYVDTRPEVVWRDHNTPSEPQQGRSSCICAIRIDYLAPIYFQVEWTAPSWCVKRLGSYWFKIPCQPYANFQGEIGYATDEYENDIELALAIAARVWEEMALAAKEHEAAQTRLSDEPANTPELELSEALIRYHCYLHGGGYDG